MGISDDLNLIIHFGSFFLEYYFISLRSVLVYQLRGPLKIFCHYDVIKRYIFILKIWAMGSCDITFEASVTVELVFDFRFFNDMF